jgi:hypothetical protein
MLQRDAGLAAALFASDRDRKSAVMSALLWGWGGQLPPMEQFFLLQPMIEAVVDDYAGFRDRLAAIGGDEASLVLAAMRTPIYAARLSQDGGEIVGEPTIVLVNDLVWEGHLIEGPWLTEQGGLFYLFYSGNDFSTAEYGIGVAVAETPLGPFRKAEQPLIRSSAEWAGPGHPSVAPGPDGRPHLFYHAFRPGHAGYKEFRALLTSPLRFAHGEVALDEGGGASLRLS